MRAGAILAAAGFAACSAAHPDAVGPAPGHGGPWDDPVLEEEAAARPRAPGEAPSESRSPTDRELEGGIRLYTAEDDRWWLQLALPVSVGFTSFEVQEIIDLGVESLTTFTVVPTVEAVVPVSRKWTLLPWAGLGGALQFGETEQVGDDRWLGLANAGLRAQMWHSLSERYGVLFTTEGRYDAALSSRDGLLGDWGLYNAAVELRRTFGEPRDGPRFQSGVYVQGFWYWIPLEIEIDGVTPTRFDDQWEAGLSLGSTTPYEILGVALPRTFVGWRVGDGLEGLRLRFGRL